MTTPSIPFYKTGGTLDYNHPSYIERTADQELYEKLKQGEFCYILTSRQMGKSSLMVRTALRLRGEGESVVTIDLTSFGNTLEREQWYDSILSRIGQQLQLESELEDFWFNHERLSPFQRWMEAISRVVLPKCPGRLILFIDEIDIVRSFNFSADEFFAGIRECYNRRAEDPEMNRLVFCLLGVLSPSELIQDAGITPFNIGQRIELNDFSLEESALLAKGLNRKQPLAGKLIERIIYWTGGHPYLTQSLCAAVARDDQVQNPRSVDRLCRKLFLTSSAIEKEDNLVFVRERLLQSKLDRAGLLNLYHQILDGKKVPDDDANPFINVLKLTGLIKATNGILQVRNRIYRKVFEHEWMRENMPDAELRRQKAAYRQGVIRTAVIACAAFILAGTGLYIYYDSTFVTHEKYYNAVIERRGVVEGFYHVPKRDVPKRIRTYKLFLKGGKVQKYQIVNCYDAPVPIERAENYFLNSQETSTDTYHQIEYIYDAKGQVVYKKFLDQSGRFLGGFVFSPASNQSRARGYYVGKDGYPKTWGEAEYVNIEWSKEGYEHKVLYVDRYGQPQPGRDRAYGILKEYYSNGLEKRLISLNADEQNIIDDYGNAIAECIYDNNNGEQKSKNLFYNLLYAKKCHGNVIESRLLDVKEKLILAKNNFAITRLTYDSFDNGITQTYYDTQNKPITSTDGFFMSTTQLIRGPKKKTYSVKNSYFDTQQVPLLVEGIYHTLECRYDQNGGFEWLYYDINNKPVSYDAVNWEQLKGQAFSPYLLSNIAYMYEFGTEVKQSSQEAVRWYSKGAVNGSPWSMYKLGEMYFNGRGVKKDCNEALNWYRQSAAVGEISAMNDLGDIYYNGNQVKQNYAEAFIWYRQGAETGDSTAMENLAWMYQKGYGVDQNYLEALNWYRKAAKAGNANSMEKIGELYFYGYGVSNNYTKAIEWFRQGAEAGNSRAMTFLGFMYQNGYGVKQDYAEALSWYRMGAEAKNAMAMYAVGQIYYNGYGATKDFKEAAKWYRMGAKYGDSLSMNDLGEMYQNGDGVKRDYKEALKWYQKGAENGNDSAMNNIGDLYYYGRGVKQDYSKAVEWYLKGANAGNTSALHNLGWMYENGYGVNQDYIEALKWYLHGAENGKASSMEKIGEIYLNGYGVPKDNPKAVEWFLKGAKAGNSESMTYLGLMYQKGAGVEQDYTEALKWYQKAAEDNDAMAMYAVGQIYYNGYGVKEDYKEAAKWFRKGADLGDSSSMNKLGEIYQNGYGVKQNYAEALKWYQKGADNGNDSAMNSLGSMYQKGYGVKQDYATAVKWYHFKASV
ncbi:MAG TPA: AAA-like domain-containing protein [Bacillota bacterium]|nr:AAA-like domain-containing protein [Bacillota bacterium]